MNIIPKSDSLTNLAIQLLYYFPLKLDVDVNGTTFQQIQDNLNDQMTRNEFKMKFTPDIYEKTKPMPDFNSVSSSAFDQGLEKMSQENNFDRLKLQFKEITEGSLKMIDELPDNCLYCQHDIDINDLIKQDQEADQELANEIQLTREALKNCEGKLEELENKQFL